MSILATRELDSPILSAENLGFSHVWQAALFLLIIAVSFNPYISSWLPTFGGYPAGAFFRLGAILIFYILTLSYIIKTPTAKVNFFLVGSAAIFSQALILSIIVGHNNFGQIAIGLHAFFLYPMIFLFGYTFLANSSSRTRISTKFFITKTATNFFFLFSMVALLDVITSGNFTLWIGYNPNYGGPEFSLINRYYDLVRANGGFADALAFGYLMSLGFIYFYFIIYSQGKTFSGLTGMLLTSSLAWLSLTRGAILALLFSWLIVFLRSTSLQKSLILLLSSIGLMSFFLFGYHEILLGRFLDTDPGSATSTELRLKMALNSLHYISENPFGVGLGTQGAGSTLSENDQRINTDNFFFHSLLELGVIGALFFCVYLIAQFSCIYKSMRNRAAFLCLAFLFIISSTFSSAFQAGILSVFFWVVCLLFTLDGSIREH